MLSGAGKLHYGEDSRWIVKYHLDSATLTLQFFLSPIIGELFGIAFPVAEFFCFSNHPKISPDPPSLGSLLSPAEWFAFLFVGAMRTSKWKKMIRPEMKHVMAEPNRLEKATTFFLLQKVFAKSPKFLQKYKWYEVLRDSPPFTWRFWTSAPGMNSVADSLSWRCTKELWSIHWKVRNHNSLRRKPRENVYKSRFLGCSIGSFCPYSICTAIQTKRKTTPRTCLRADM